MKKTMNKRALGVALPFVLSIGCASSQAQRVEDARMAEIEAQKKERLENIDKRTAADSDRIAQVGDRRQESIESSERPGAEARGEIAEVSAERAQYRNDVTGRLDKLEVRLKAAKGKRDVLGSRAPTSLGEDISTAMTQHGNLKQRVAELQAVEPSNWARTKAELEQGLDNLERRIENLNEAIDDV
jgi:TolA-binding protein